MMHYLIDEWMEERKREKEKNLKKKRSWRGWEEGIMESQGINVVVNIYRK